MPVRRSSREEGARRAPPVRPAASQQPCEDLSALGEALVSGQSRRSGDRRLASIGGRYTSALCAADAPAVEALVAEALAAGLAPTAIQVGVITQGMKRIGDLWEQGELTIADEHVATGLSNRALLPLQEPLQIAPPRSRERIVLAGIEGQTHVLGLQMVADVLEGAGFEVFYLGADVPSAALHAFVAEHSPAIVGLTSTQESDAPRLAAAIVAIHDAHPAARIMLGGNGVPAQWRDALYPWVPDATSVLDTAEQLLHSPPQQQPAVIAELHSNVIETPTSSPESASFIEEERLAAGLTDTGEVARRYARLAAEFRYLAYRDPLTALPNRRSFDDRMITLSNTGQDNALLVIDVDEFKEINDTQGHDAGDALLRHLAQTIHSAIRTGDTLARIGGNEFTVLLPDCTQTEATRVAEQIGTAVFAMSDGKTTVSIGGSALGSDRRGALLSADSALYAAKAAGRNRTQVTAT